MLTRYLAAFVIVILSIGMICGIAYAASGDNSPVSLDLKDADVKSAIESLFKGKNINYSVGSDVQGVISSMSIKDVPFDQALKSLLKTAGLVYRVENGVYMINKKPETSTMTQPTPDYGITDTAQVDTTTTAESIIDRIPLTYAGPSDILNIIGGNTNNNQNSQNGTYGSNFNISTSGGSSSSGSHSSSGSSRSSSSSSRSW